MLQGQSISSLIDKAVERTHVEEERNYIGASSIGHTCARAIWYAFKGTERKPLTAKQIRTFEIGKRLELMIKEEIKLLGFKLIDELQLTTCYDDEVTVFQGSVDGILEIDGKLVILEIKTAKDSSFKLFVNKGLRKWRPEYYSQVQAYMGMKGIDTAYILAINKDTSELHDEYVQFDDFFYHELKAKAKMISKAEEPPERINKSPLYYICSMCNYKETCHA
jgi:hypothetical protein